MLRRMPGRAARGLLAAAFGLAMVALTGAVSPGVAAGASPAVLTTHGSPFDPDGDGVRERVRIRLALALPVTATIRIHDFDGRRVRTLATDRPLAAGAHEWTWDGRDRAGRRVPSGPYRIRATVRDGSGAILRRSAWITRARLVPYAVRPGAILVAIDPGHGGPADGAVWRGLREDAVNLDIGLRLEAMLKGAGVRVVMTRRSDRNVNPKRQDLNGDGRYTRVDELIARNDVANEARADIHLALHNNGIGCHCTRGTEMYTHFGRSWAPEGRKLARFLLDEHLRHLRRLPGYTPRGRGVISYPFKALKPYHRVAMPRPSLQPSVLGESLFIDWPSEHRILGRRSGRTAIAAAYFDGIARYLRWRPFGLRYEVLDAPVSAAPGAGVAVTLRLTNTGARASKGWRLVARIVPAVPRYDGRPGRGDVVAAMAVPDGLARGESLDLVLADIPLPGRAGEWLVKIDVRRPGGVDLSRHGVVGPQLRVRTAAP